MHDMLVMADKIIQHNVVLKERLGYGHLKIVDYLLPKVLKN